MKANIKRPKPSNRPQAFESDQGIEFPPHCRAKNIQTILEIKSTVPVISSFWIFCLAVRVTASLFGSRNANSIISIVKPQKATSNQFSVSKELGCSRGDPRRFSQKQNLQVSLALSVNTPPRGGPDNAAAPYIELNTLKYTVILFIGTDS